MRKMKLIFDMGYKISPHALEFGTNIKHDNLAETGCSGLRQPVSLFNGKFCELLKIPETMGYSCETQIA